MDHVPIQAQETTNKHHDVPIPMQPTTTPTQLSTTGHVPLLSHDVPIQLQPITTLAQLSTTGHVLCPTITILLPDV